MRTIQKTFNTIRGTEVVSIDIFKIDAVEAIDVYEQDARRFNSGGWRVEGTVSGVPAGTKFISDGLGYMVEGDAIDALRAFLIQS